MITLKRIRTRMAAGLQLARDVFGRERMRLEFRAAYSWLSAWFGTWVRRGGLRLKLIGLNSLIIFITVVTFGYLAGNVMERAISEKAFEVARVSSERIGDFSSSALLERSYESRVDLDEALRVSRERGVSGILDISIYATQKTGDQLGLTYFTGYLPGERHPLDEPLARKVLAHDSAEVFIEPPRVLADGDTRAYRFVKPIIFTYEGNTRLLGAVVLSYAEETIAGPVRAAHGILLWATVGVLLISTPILYVLGSHLTRPIIAVASAARKVGQGDLDVSLDLRTHDEIDELRQEFMRMVSGLKERRLMSKYVSGSTVEMIRDRQYADVHLGGTYKRLTFLFSDVRGFTAMSEKMDPEQLVSVINFYLELQSEIIHEHGGDIDKFVGDEVMAVFSGRRNIERALAAAVAIRKAIEESNVTRRREGLPVLQVGIGINHGKVLVGNIGAPERMDFTSIGAAVNLAARLCSEAGPAEILIQRQAYQLTARTHAAASLPPFSVSGFSEPIEAMLINE